MTAPLTWVCYEWGLLDYREAWAVQVKLVAARHEGRLDRDLLLLLEHPPVYTLGRRGRRDSLNVPEGFLEDRGIPVVQVERGGDITYHGPGQLIGYPILNLRRLGLGVVTLVERLEALMLQVAADWGVSAQRNPRNRGVWVGPKKLGSIGLAVRHQISYHGFALNVNNDLSPFEWIHPCGLHGVRMTSLAAERGSPLPMDEVRQAVRHHFEALFGVQLTTRPPSDLAGL